MTTAPEEGIAACTNQPIRNEFDLKIIKEEPRDVEEKAIDSDSEATDSCYEDDCDGQAKNQSHEFSSSPSTQTETETQPEVSDVSYGTESSLIEVDLSVVKEEVESAFSDEEFSNVRLEQTDSFYEADAATEGTPDDTGTDLNDAELSSPPSATAASEFHFGWLTSLENPVLLRPIELPPTEESPQLRSNLRTLSCTVCQKRFPSESSLKTHMTFHTKSKPHACDQCSKSFSTRYSLKLHKTTHQQPKSEVSVNNNQNNPIEDRLKPPLISDDLCLTFFKLNDLESKVSPPQPPRPFACNECPKRFSTNYALRHHLVVHTGLRPFECNVCSKTFALRYSFLAHMRLHTGGKQFECKVCGRAFAHKPNMDSHMTLHTGERPYKCVHCQKRFSQKSNLNTHMKTHKKR